MYKNSGFTLIELLIVISLVGVLSGILLSTINVNRQRDIATDSVRASTMSKLAQGFESFFASSGRPATDSDSDYNPFTNTNSSELAEIGRFIVSWPSTNVSGQEYRYYSNSSNFCLSVPMASVTTTYYKYMNPDAVTSSSCKGKVMRSCTNQCSSAGTGFSAAGCTNLDGVTCN